MTARIFVALDTPSLDAAKAIATRVRHHVGGIKLGLEFFSAHGQAGVREMAALNLPIFLDLKLHDIPNTVAKAVQALSGLQPAILTVHAAGGLAMMEDAKAAAPAGTKVVAVTVLTSRFSLLTHGTSAMFLSCKASGAATLTTPASFSGFSLARYNPSAAPVEKPTTTTRWLNPAKIR